MYVLVLLVILCVALAVWSCTRTQASSPPLYPGALPLIGHAHMLLGDRKLFWKTLQKWCSYSMENGGVILVKFSSLHNFYVLTDPEDSLLAANTCFSKPYIYEFAKKFVNNGLITAEVSTWKSHRKLINPAFNQQVLNSFSSEMNIQARSLVSQLASEVGMEQFDVKRHLANFVMKVVSRTTLGLKTGDQALIDKNYVKTVEDLFVIYVERVQKPWLHLSYLYNKSATKRKEDKLLEKINDILKPVISERKHNLRETKYNVKSGSIPESFVPILDNMLDLVNKQNAFTDDEIREHINTFVAAAYDTTTVTLKYILLMLGSYPDVQEQVFTELQAVFGHKDVDCTKDELPKLVYLEAVVKETLRVYPAVCVVLRNVHTDVKLKHCTLRAGGTCMIGLYGINRDPKLWGADAEQFRPERWLDPAALPNIPNAFVPFGIGKRNCIGKLYSMMVMKTAIAHIVKRYHITSDIKNLELEFDIVNQPVAGDLINIKLRP